LRKKEEREVRGDSTLNGMFTLRKKEEREVRGDSTLNGRFPPSKALPFPNSQTKHID
jgi:hypothetical protein